MLLRFKLADGGEVIHVDPAAVVKVREVEATALGKAAVLHQEDGSKDVVRDDDRSASRRVNEARRQLLAGPEQRPEAPPDAVAVEADRVVLKVGTFEADIDGRAGFGRVAVDGRPLKAVGFAVVAEVNKRPRVEVVLAPE